MQLLGRLAGLCRHPRYSVSGFWARALLFTSILTSRNTTQSFANPHCRACSLKRILPPRNASAGWEVRAQHAHCSPPTLHTASLTTTHFTSLQLYERSRDEAEPESGREQETQSLRSGRLAKQDVWQLRWQWQGVKQQRRRRRWRSD